MSDSMEDTMNTVRSLQTRQDDSYAHLGVRHEQDYRTVWYDMQAQPRSCFTSVLLREIHHFFNDLRNQKKYPGVEYVVLCSDVPGVFNLGGDLNRFIQCIQEKNREGLMEYAIACIDVLHLNHTGIGSGITTVSLVQGDALGGGFEAAISSDVLIAECSAKMGFPEILFNLFPGMGAYSFLSRKIGHALAERMIMSGRLYSAEELFEMGVVDVLAEDGHGEKEVYDYISREDKTRNGITAFRAARKCTNPLSYDELRKVTEIWVDAALNLRDRDLRMMERLVNRQTAKRA